MLNQDPLEEWPTGPLPDDEDTFHDIDFRTALEKGQDSEKSTEVGPEFDNVRSGNSLLTFRCLYSKHLVSFMICFLMFHIGYCGSVVNNTHGSTFASFMKNGLNQDRIISLS